MSNTPESTIFGKMTSRPAGKRQIKPTAVLFATLTENHSSDDEDEDFEVKTGETGENASDQSSSESGSDEEEEEDSEDSGNEKSPSNDREIPENVNFCGVCVNQKTSDDFLQCERCKIHVHASCYGANGEIAPFHCEPCKSGLAEPPYCEMCPSRLGAFKMAVVPGRWCHVVCALFTHGVRFVKPETRSLISWTHLENAQFGKRTCLSCTDKIEARLGLSSRCESGLCKEILHITCAQKMGLLVDEEENSAFSRYFFCKKHSNSDNLRKFQKKFEIFEKLEQRRILVARRLPVLQVLDKKPDFFKNSGSEDRQKQPRLLNTSSEFFDRFESKAIDSGMTKESFRDPFFNIRMSNNTTSFPIGFSKEYIDFMHLRDTQIIPEEEEKLRKAREILSETKEKHEKQQNSGRFQENELKIAEKCENLARLREILEKFGELPPNFPTTKTTKTTKTTQKCAVCSGTEDVHKQTQCDNCHQSYHIGCLNPPLTRLPKRNKVGWICHECNESSDSEVEILDTSETRSSRSRRPPARLSAFVNH